MPSSVFPAVDLSNVTGTLPVANGGTGLATLTAHALYVGNGTSAPTALSVGTTGQVLTGATGADPVFSSTLADSIVATKGSGSATGPLTATLLSDVTQRATGADTNATDLFTYTIPANTLNANGKAICVSTVGKTAANANTKTLTAQVAATSATQGALALNNCAWNVDIEFTRLTSSTGVMKVISPADTAARIGVLRAELSGLDFTSTITMKVIGTNGSAVANDIVYLAGRARAEY